MVYNYFISFAQNTETTHGWGWRILSFKIKPTVGEIQETLEKYNKEFKEISIINFKLLTKKEVSLVENDGEKDE